MSRVHRKPPRPCRVHRAVHKATMTTQLNTVPWSERPLTRSCHGPEHASIAVQRAVCPAHGTFHRSAGMQDDPPSASVLVNPAFYPKDIFATSNPRGAATDGSSSNNNYRRARPLVAKHEEQADDMWTRDSEYTFHTLRLSSPKDLYRCR